VTVRVYSSTDASAPVLTGTAGSLISVLDAVLVNGYGSMTAAGWTKPFSTTNKAAYKQNTTGANNPSGMYAYVDDNGPGTHGGREARVCGFETMSAITPTGTGQFPTAGQSTIGVGTLVIRKSTTADATARRWTCIANGQTFYFFSETADTTSPYMGNCGFMFGDITPTKSGDQYATMIIGRAAEGQTSTQYDPIHCIGAAGSTIYLMSSTIYGHFIARHWTQLGSSVKCGKTWDTSRVAMCNLNGGGMNGGWQNDTQLFSATYQTGFGRFMTTVGIPFPHGPDNGILVSPVEINHGNGIRGLLRGFWGPLHDRPLSPYDTITVSSGPLSGKTFMAIYVGFPTNNGNNVDSCCIFIETSDTWN
jgi:hypothetical protein